MSRQVVFTRTLLGLGDLTITSNPVGNAYWLPEDGFNEPEFSERTTFAEDSAHVPGSLATQSVTGIGSWSAVIYTQAADETALKANKRALEAAVRQFRYTLGLTIVGAAESYAAIAGNITWGELDSGMVARKFARCVVTIPVQPLGA